MSSHAYSTYLFDLDGTLLDTVALIVASHHHTRDVHFGERLSDAEVIASMGRTLFDTYGEMAAGRDVATMVATYRAFNHEHHDRMTAAYDGVAATLEQLQQRGARLAVVTSKSQSLARRGLQVTGIDRFFSLVIGGDDVTRGKPDPEPVLKALASLDAPAQGCVFVGDSTHDMQSGRRAGVATAAALWGPFERAALEHTTPNHWLATPDELLAL